MPKGFADEISKEGGGQSVGAQDSARSLVREFMARYSVPGLSVAFAKGGQPTFRAAFGYADAGKREPLKLTHLMRIASVSKPITAVCVFRLVEQGLLKLNAPVFGDEGVLKLNIPSDRRTHLSKITVQHLLTHTSGAWGSEQSDPMFQVPNMPISNLIEEVVRRSPLPNLPGTRYDYSNFGYSLLGRVVEQITGQPYAQAVQKLVLSPCNITGMKIGGNSLDEKSAGEVSYVGQQNENPYGFNLTRMDAHGGWVATASDLLQFMLHVDGLASPRDILKEGTLKAMLTASPSNRNYACGWAVNDAPNWWHIGSLPGTTALAVRTAGGMSWTALANTRIRGIDIALDDLMWSVAKVLG
jgi:CubicO group peptidase (beta-lactamase class C family)